MKIAADFKERKWFLGAMIALALVPLVFLIHSIVDHVFGLSGFGATLNVFDWLLDLVGIACMGFLIFALLTDRLNLFLPAGFAGLALVHLFKLNMEFFYAVYLMSDYGSDYTVRALLSVFLYCTTLLCYIATVLFFAAQLMKVPFLEKIKPLTQKIWFAPIILCALPVLLGVFCFWVNFFVYNAEYFFRYFDFGSLLDLIWRAIKDLFYYYSFSQMLVTAAVAFICLELNKMYGTSKPKKVKAAAPEQPAPAPYAAPEQPAWDVPQYAAPEQPVWDAPQYAAPEQPAWDAPQYAAPEQPAWDAPQYAAPEQPAWDAPQYAVPEAPVWDAPQSVPDNDPFEALRQYKAQLDSGMITQAEYEAKRREVLGL